MNTPLTEDTKATLLLCGIFDPKRAKRDAVPEELRPLALGEYNALVQWLQNASLRPRDLLQQEQQEAAAVETTLDAARIKVLMARGAQLAFAVEEWQRDGIWVVSRSDVDYPLRYKEHLGKKCPPLLFGVGDRALLRGGGLAVVGSRKVDAASAQFSQRVGALCARNGMSVVSGGAVGVDSVAMQACVDAGGVSIGVLADSLLKKSVECSARTAIADGQLLLISPYHPRAPFYPGNAMGRNKLIYALADCALAVCAQAPKSGTLSGATEELKRANAVPVFVRLAPDVPQGNWELLALGAVPWLDMELNEDLAEGQDLASFFRLLGKTLGSTPTVEAVAEVPSVPHEALLGEVEPQEKSDMALRMYEAILSILMDFLEYPHSLDEVAQLCNVSKTQMNVWLKRAVAEKKVVKLTKPLRYQRAPAVVMVRGTLL